MTGSFYKPTNNLASANGRVKNIAKYFRVAIVNFLVLVGDQISEFLCYHAINVINPK